MKPCEVSLAHKINQIKNNAESARTMALALLLFWKTQLNIMPIGIRKKDEHQKDVACRTYAESAVSL